MQTKPLTHIVENQRCAMPCANFFDGRDEAGLGEKGGLEGVLIQGVQEQGRDFSFVLVRHRAKCVHIVPGNPNHMVPPGRWNPRRRPRGQLGSRAVVGLVNGHDQRAPCGLAGYPTGQSQDLRARLAQHGPSHARVAVHQHFGEFHQERRVEVGARRPSRLLEIRLLHPRMPVAQKVRTVGTNEIQVLLAVYIGHPATLSIGNEPRQNALARKASAAGEIDSPAGQDPVGSIPENSPFGAINGRVVPQTVLRTDHGCSDLTTTARP